MVKRLRKPKPTPNQESLFQPTRNGTPPAIALGRKNHLFAGSHAAAQRSAVLYALFATCKLQSTNPIEWLTDVLRRLPTHPADRMAELLPHHWKASRDLQQATVKKAA